MNKEQETQSAPLTLEDFTAHAVEVTLRAGHHVPTLLVEGRQSSVLIVIPGIPSTHAQRLRQMFTLGFALALRLEVAANGQVENPLLVALAHVLLRGLSERANQQ